MDFVGYAKSFGIEAEEVSTPDDFADAFDKALAADGPRVIVLHIHRSFVEPMTKGGARINEFVDFK
jgi:acetolactate synthase-1/2/3 large subunit